MLEATQWLQLFTAVACIRRVLCCRHGTGNTQKHKKSEEHWCYIITFNTQSDLHLPTTCQLQMAGRHVAKLLLARTCAADATDPAQDPDEIQ